MKKIKLDNLIQILNYDVVNHHSCIEMEFYIDNDVEYEECWLGKMTDRNNPNKELYWYGLSDDGSQAYTYSKLEDILNAKVFHGQSICDVIENITWDSLDGCDIDERLSYYIDIK